MKTPKPDKCFTIGYGNSSIDLFITVLIKTGIEILIDVRSIPYSRFNPDFRREPVEKFLSGHGIEYRFLGNKIGGRQTDPGLLFPDGSANYQKIQETEKFLSGINEVLAIISGGKSVALMCAENEPERCHRFTLISPVLQERGVFVIHIRPDGRLQANEDLEREMVRRLFDTSQARLTGPVDLIAEMYKRVGQQKGPRNF